MKVTILKKISFLLLLTLVLSAQKKIELPSYRLELLYNPTYYQASIGLSFNNFGFISTFSAGFARKFNPDELYGNPFGNPKSNLFLLKKEHEYWLIPVEYTVSYNRVEIGLGAEITNIRSYDYYLNPLKSWNILRKHEGNRTLVGYLFSIAYQYEDGYAVKLNIGRFTNIKFGVYVYL